MNLRSIKSLIPSISPGGLVVLVVILGVSFLAIVLLPGLKLASELVNSTVALKVVGEQQRHPTLIRASLETMHDRLSAHGYIQEAVDQLRDSSGKIDTILREMGAERSTSWFGRTADTAVFAAAISEKHAAVLRDLWAREHEALSPVLGFTGVPYQDNESTGTVLNDGGRQLDRDLNAALRTSRHTLPLLDTELAAIATELQATNARSATQLRLVMFLGLLIAGVLVSLVTILLRARQRQEASLQEARQQTTDILRTVKDGLFLLDEKLIIGSAYSSALESLFQRTDIAGLAFEALLKNIVSEKTLSTALKFVKVLWAERTNEKLVKTINPLGEVEVHIDIGQGKFETRYLQFEFHRVRVEDVITNVLVSVSDVSIRVDLAKERQASQGQAQAQVDTLLGILHIDPAQLVSFLSDSNAAMKMINTVLREPAREEGAFRKKLDTIFRQVHSVKGEAAALGLSSIESRAHSFEDDLKSLREKSDLSGNDFLPLVIKLDDLLTHLQSVSDLVARLSRLQTVSAEAAHTSATMMKRSGPQEMVNPDVAGIGSVLQQLAVRVATENNKDATLQCRGFESVPVEYRRIVKDIAIQAVRNAIVHGIEPAPDRLAMGKPEQGVVSLVFQDLGSAGYKFIAEDDGQGLSTERIKEVAQQRGFITPEQAETLDARQTFSLLFKPGFSTVDVATKDAGRGVGMNLMAGLMNQIGGRVSVATSAGKFTRWTLSLPPATRRADEAEVA